MVLLFSPTGMMPDDARSKAQLRVWQWRTHVRESTDAADAVTLQLKAQLRRVQKMSGRNR